jgi:hypothetical protein
MTNFHFTCTQAGGHGIAWDGPFNKELRRLVEETYATGKIIAAVDHGPAALVHARNIRLGDPREGMPLLFRKDVRAPASTCLLFCFLYYMLSSWQAEDQADLTELTFPQSCSCLKCAHACQSCMHMSLTKRSPDRIGRHVYHFGQKDMMVFP